MIFVHALMICYIGQVGDARKAEGGYDRRVLGDLERRGGGDPYIRGEETHDNSKVRKDDWLYCARAVYPWRGNATGQKNSAIEGWTGASGVPFLCAYYQQDYYRYQSRYTETHYQV